MAGYEPGDLEHLIDRHMTLLEVRRRLAEEEPGDAERKRPAPGAGPWITFSKQLGSGGQLLAERVGERLGWHLFDREILEAIARSTRTREKILSRLDERAVGRLDEFFANILTPREPSQEAFLREMARVIWALGREGHAILLGRGANWILEPRHGLRVRVTAPLKQRAATVSQGEGLSLADAEKRIREDDAQRINFIRQVYNRDISDPLGYDLILNTADLEPDAAVEIVLAALRIKVGVAAPADPVPAG